MIISISVTSISIKTCRNMSSRWLSNWKHKDLDVTTCWELLSSFTLGVLLTDQISINSLYDWKTMSTKAQPYSLSFEQSHSALWSRVGQSYRSRNSNHFKNRQIYSLGRPAEPRCLANVKLPRSRPFYRERANSVADIQAPAIPFVSLTPPRRGDSSQLLPAQNQGTFFGERFDLAVQGKG